MLNRALDPTQRHLEERVADSAFERHFGSRAQAFFAHLPALFHLYRRIPFDGDVSLATRHRAAAIAFYIADNQDYLGDAGAQDTGLVDDVYMAFASLVALVDDIGDDVARRHWRGKGELDDAVALAHSIDALRQHVPSKVLERCDRYLGIG